MYCLPGSLIKGFYLKSILYNYSHPGYLEVTICREYLIFILSLSPMYAHKSKVSESLINKIELNIIIIHTPTRCLLIGEFSPFTFKVIIHQEGPSVAILLIIFCCLTILSSMFSSLACLCFIILF